MDVTLMHFMQLVHYSLNISSVCVCLFLHTQEAIPFHQLCSSIVHGTQSYRMVSDDLLMCFKKNYYQTFVCHQRSESIQA